MWIKKNWDGQDFEVDFDLGLIKTHISSVFVTAGSKYGWDGVRVGVSLNSRILNFAFSQKFPIILTVGSSVTRWKIDASEWLDFSEHYSAVYFVRDIKLYVIKLDSPPFRRV